MTGANPRGPGAFGSWWGSRGRRPSPYSSARTSFAAATMFSSAGLTSGQPRVFRPQSGLTQSRSGGMAAAARAAAAAAISSASARAGEWMS